MNDKEFQLYLHIITTDELVEVLEFRETLALLYCDIDTGTSPALMARNERLCALLKSELARRGAFGRPEVVDRLNAGSRKFWPPFTEEDREGFRTLGDDLAQDFWG